jgi:AraC family transcriptional regulator
MPEQVGWFDVRDPETKTAYLRRFRRVLEHIEHNLGTPLSLTELSDVASSSPYHFHRQFTSLVGATVSKYVHLRRLHTSLWQLVYRPDVSVLHVALNAGYESPEAFTRAFRRVLGVTPSEFRCNPAWSEWYRTYGTIRTNRTLIMNSKTSIPPVTLLQFPETRLAVLEHRGSHDALPASIHTFISYRRRNELPRERHATFNLVYDNPQTTEPDAYRMDLGCAITRPVDPNPEGVIEKVIPAGRCAYVRCHGGDDMLEQCLTYLYGVWLPGSGECIRDFPLFFQRIVFFPDVPEHEAITDIFLPLEAEKNT